MKMTLARKTFVEVPTGKGKPAKREECYLYANVDGTVKVEFYANPKRAWSYLLGSETNEDGRKLAGRLINEWTRKGIEAMGRKPVEVTDAGAYLDAETRVLEV